MIERDKKMCLSRGTYELVHTKGQKNVTQPLKFRIRLILVFYKYTTPRKPLFSSCHDDKIFENIFLWKFNDLKRLLSVSRTLF